MGCPRTRRWGAPNVHEFRTEFRSRGYRDRAGRGDLGFELELRHRGEPPFNLLDTDGIFTNLKYLNPEIEVYRRLAEAAGDPDHAD